MERGDRKRGGMMAKSTRSFHHFISPLLRFLQVTTTSEPPESSGKGYGIYVFVRRKM